MGRGGGGVNLPLPERHPVCFTPCHAPISQGRSRRQEARSRGVQREFRESTVYRGVGGVKEQTRDMKATRNFPQWKAFTALGAGQEEQGSAQGWVVGDPATARTSGPTMCRRHGGKADSGLHLLFPEPPAAASHQWNSRRTQRAGIR